MDAVRYRLRAVLRRRRWSLVGLVLLVGLAGGVVLASVAAARRTQGSYSAMVERSQAWQVLVNPNSASWDETVPMIAALPHVAQIGGERCAAAVPDEIRTMHDLETYTGSVAMIGGFGYDFARPVIRDGRMPAADAPDELFLDQRWADARSIRAGDVITMRIPTEEALATGDVNGWVTGTAGRRVDMTVAGLGIAPDTVIVDEGYEALGVALTPAFWEAYGHPDCGFWGAAVRLDDPSSEAEFRASVAPLFPRDPESGQGGVNFQTLRATTDKVDRAIRPEVVTLQVFAAVMTLVGLLLVGQAVSRRLQNDVGDNLTLDAMGFGRRQRFAVSVALVGVVAVAGASLAALLAYVLSPLAPFGLARLTDPHPGLAFDGLAVGLGAVVVAVVVVLVGLAPAWRTAAVATRSDPVRSSVLTRLATQAGLGPSATTGVRFALEPGRGRNAVPVRATLLGAVTAVAIVAGVLTFAGSLDNLLDTPKLYGSGWDASVRLDVASATLDDLPEGTASAIAGGLLAASPLVDGYAAMFAAELSIDGRPVPVVALQPGDRPVGATVAEGRAPSAPGEVALGANTMSTFGVGVGDQVSIAAEGGTPTDHLVVGRVVLPGVGTYPGSDKTALGEGALFSLDGLTAVVPPLEQGLAVRMAPGVTVDELQSSLRADLAATSLPDGVAEAFVDVTRPNRPSDIISLGRMRRTPLVLSALLVLLVAGTVANALFLAVRRRRVDLAVLRALGATGRQLLATVGWQASTVAVVAGVIGVPLGVVVGRWAWTVLADALGTTAPPVVPWVALGVTGVIVVLLANLIGLIPGSRAARATASSVLRSE